MSVEVILVTMLLAVLGLLVDNLFPHLMADECATTAVVAPLISGALLSVVLGLLVDNLFPQSARLTSAEAILATVLGLLGQVGDNLFPHQMAEGAGVSAAEAVGQAG
jgi:F0F1-type ATP synthase assembly protein I